MAWKNWPLPCPRKRFSSVYQIALTGRRDLSLAPDPALGFEMTLLRMLAFRPAGMNGTPPERTGKSGSGP